MSIDAILTGQQKSYTKAEEDAFLTAKAEKKDFVYTESSTSATRDYRVGEYFYWTDGSIYRAQENIASGYTLVASGNCNRVGGNGALNSAQNSKVEKSDLTIINGTGSTATNSYKAGEYFYWRNSLCQAITDISSGTTLTESTNYIPTQGLSCKLSTWDPTSGNTNTDVTVPSAWESANQYFRQGNLLVVFFKIRPTVDLQDGTSIVLCSNVTSTFNISNVLNQFSMAACVHHRTSSTGSSDILLRVSYSPSNNTLVISNSSGVTAGSSARCTEGQITLIVY